MSNDTLVLQSDAMYVLKKKSLLAKISLILTLLVALIPVFVRCLSFLSVFKGEFFFNAFYSSYLVWNSLLSLSFTLAVVTLLFAGVWRGSKTALFCGTLFFTLSFLGRACLYICAYIARFINPQAWAYYYTIGGTIGDILVLLCGVLMGLTACLSVFLLNRSYSKVGPIITAVFAALFLVATGIDWLVDIIRSEYLYDSLEMLVMLFDAIIDLDVEKYLEVLVTYCNAFSSYCATPALYAMLSISFILISFAIVGAISKSAKADRELEEGAKEEPKASPAAPAAPPENGVEELKRYKQLLDDGIISQEEFNKKRRELLGF